MENLSYLLEGFANLWTVDALLWCLIGVLAGTLVGALPGLGAVAAIAVLIPLTFTLETIPALMLLMGIYQGAMYGGRISSILINVPGDPSSVVTTFDGYPMTQQGRAGYALSISAIASFLGGAVGFLGLVLLMPYLSQFGLMFGPPEMFALMVLALVATSGLGRTDLLKGLLVVGIGVLIGLIGLDSVSGDVRMSFSSVELWDGLSFIAIAVGLFGFSEVLVLVLGRQKAAASLPRITLRNLIPDRSALGRNLGSTGRGSIVGFILGVLPGAGATIATFVSYDVERRVAKKPEKFGKGADQGLSGPEAASNASIGGALVPLLTLGIPASAITAVLLGALVMVGLQPGPRLLESSGDIVWTTIAGLLLANVLLLILNTAFVPVFSTLIRQAQPYLISFVAALCVLGVYLERSRLFDVGVMLVFGVLGYFMRVYGFPLAPLILAVLLGPGIEQNLRQSLLLGDEPVMIFLTRPITLSLLIGVIAILAIPPIVARLRRRGEPRRRRRRRARQSQ